MADAPTTLIGALSRAIGEHPDRTAVQDGALTLSYRELGDRIRLLATGLRRRLPVGGGPIGVPLVATLLPAGADFVAMAAAITSAGCAYLPLDPAAPPGYLDTMLRAACPDLLITATGEPPVGEIATVSCADLTAVGEAPRAKEGQGPAVSLDTPAYVIFTSGSSGTPKGVVVGHGALLASTAGRHHHYGPAERVPLLHSVGVDVSVGVMWWTLLSGGTLLIGPPLADVPATVDFVRDQHVTHLVYAAGLYPLFLELTAATGPLRDLRTVMIGSEAWGAGLADRHRALLPEASLWNEYGPTEACVWSSGAHVYDASTGRQKPVTLGSPLPGVGYRLMDPDTGALLDHGEEGMQGELVITGDTLAAGYLGQPELTKAQFPILPGGERGYRTGDCVTRTPHGPLEYLGRLDRQVKIGGVRVEPGQIERILLTHPDVQKAHVAALAHPADPGARVLVAFVEVTVPTAGLESSIRAHLADRLPAAAVPGVVQILQALPVTANGKIDASALPSPFPAAPHPGGQMDAFGAEIAALVGVSRLEEDTSLLTAGATSLTLTRIIARIAARYGVRVAMTDLTADPTLAALRRLTTQPAPAADRPTLTAARRTGERAPLSGQQHQLWLLDRLFPGSCAYQTQCTLHLDGLLDLDALTGALQSLVDRHEILRTTLHDGPDGPYQQIHAPWRVALEITDLTGRPGELGTSEVIEAEADRITAAHAAHRFDVGTLPLIRWRLLRTGAQRWRLLQVEHHLPHDGWSVGVLLTELQSAYAALAAGQQPDLPALALQYRDYAAWYHAWRTSSDFTAHTTHWAAVLDGAAPTGPTFEPDLLRPARQSHAGALLRATVPDKVLAALDTITHQQGVTRFGLFMTAFALLARAHTGTKDLTIGTALANRTDPRTEALLGMFVNAIPLRIAAPDTATIGDLARTVQEALTAAHDHQELPFTDILAAAGVPRELSCGPLFSLMFAFHDSPRPQTFTTGGLTVRVHIDHNGSAKGDVNVVCVPTPPGPGGQGGVEVLWEYDTGLYTPESARRHLDGFLAALAALAAGWEHPVSEVDLAGGQPHGLHGRAPVPCGHRVLHAGVATAPAAAAIIHRGRTVTYRDLDEQARGIETAVEDLDIGTGAVVAIACPPGPTLVAALLAVARRGAAYLCLDLAQPQPRQRAILAQAEAAVLITDAAPTRKAADLDRYDLPVIVAEDLKRGGRPRRPCRSGDSPAYVVFTSGSTGEPKGVQVTHTAAIAALTARTAVFTDQPGGAPPRTLITLPAAFDVAPSMIFWTLWCGGTVVFPDRPGDVADPAALRALADRHKVTCVNFVASFYRQFLDGLTAPWDTSLQVVAIGGEPCPPDLPAAHADLLGQALLCNEYGPTEATVWATAHVLHRPGAPAAQQAATGQRVPVGKPLPGMSIYVVDEQLRPVPIGARGEVCIAGPSLATGYLADPDLTGRRFLTLSHGPLAGTRFYRTGDLGRIRSDGRLEVLGRGDDQVKIRGHRIEPAEISRCLTGHPDVTDAHITADFSGAHGAGALRLIAHIAAPGRADAPELAAELRQWAADRLPAPMRPAAYTITDQLPLTAHGKIDRTALAARTPFAPPAGADKPAPERGAVANCAMGAMRDIWADVLGIDGLDVDTDFFTAGGDSLQAIRISHAARTAGLPVTVGEVLEARTVRTLASRLQNARSMPAVAHPAGTPVVLTGAQGWFFAQEFTDPDHFAQARAYTLPQGTDSARLAAAVDAALARHQAFRTRFQPGPRGWTASLTGHTTHHTPVLLLPDTATATATEQIMSGMYRSLSIGDGILHTTAVLQTSAGRLTLLLVLHHLIVDAVSWDILAGDINRAYTSGDTDLLPAAALPAPAPRPSVGELGYWRSLAAAPKPVLPLRAGKKRATFGGRAHLTRVLDGAASRFLTRTGPALHSVSAQALLLAALTRALSPLTGGGLYTMLEGHGRTGLDDAGDLVGWLTCLHPVLLPAPISVNNQADDPAGLIVEAAAIHAHLADIPRDGAGFAAGRYLRPHGLVGQALADLDLPEVTVNYLGRRSKEQGMLRSVTLPDGQTIGPGNTPPTALDITLTHHDDGLVHVVISYDPQLLAGQHVADVADRLAALTATAGRLVPLTATGPGTASRYLIHPVGGAVTGYQRLAARLTGQTCYGLPQPDLPPGSGVADLAAAHYLTITTHRPHGPYRLTGWSFGGPVAFETARLLELASHETDLLILDPPPAAITQDAADAVLLAHLAALLPAHPADQLATAVTAVTGNDDPRSRTWTSPARVERLLKTIKAIRPVDAETARQIALLVANTAAAVAWQPTGTLGSLTIAARPDSDLAHWDALTDTDPRIVHIDTDHTGLLTDPAVLALHQAPGGETDAARSQAGTAAGATAGS